MTHDTEKDFEADTEAWLTSADGGWAKATDAAHHASLENTPSTARAEMSYEEDRCG